jgi:hypothetical protein
MVNGVETPLSSAHVDEVAQGGRMGVTVHGLKPGTTAVLWGFSTPMLLTSLDIDAHQSATATFTLPTSMAPGSHTLVLVGDDAAGRKAQLQVGIIVTGSEPKPVAAAATAPTGSGSSWPWWLLAAFAVGAMIPLFFLARRRRRDEDEPRSLEVG